MIAAQMQTESQVFSCVLSLLRLATKQGPKAPATVTWTFTEHPTELTAIWGVSTTMDKHAWTRKMQGRVDRW